uniref:Uncharacterized protein n=1 Tax=Rhizophora mucronata TaxID=61149 RepID=A0A2P2PF22_RHIMU
MASKAKILEVDIPQ